MNILVCGGKLEADYVLGAFQKHGNHIVVMNEDEETADLLSEHYGIDVMRTDPTKIFSFEVADVQDFDLVVSLMERDADNFVVCLIAKELFGIKKAICTVNNPNNVAIFQRLGIESPISASYLLTEKIKGESDVESIFRTLSLENEKIVITEIKIQSEFPCCGQSLKDLGLPRTGNITCIFRDPEVIIPRGDTVIQENDTMVIASAPENQADLIDFIKKGPTPEMIEEQEAQKAQIEAAKEKAKLEKAAEEQERIEQAVQARLAQMKEEEEAKAQAADTEEEKPEEESSDTTEETEQPVEEEEKPQPSVKPTRSSRRRKSSSSNSDK